MVFGILYELSIVALIMGIVLLIVLKVLKGYNSRDFNYLDTETNVNFKLRRSEVVVESPEEDLEDLEEDKEANKGVEDLIKEEVKGVNQDLKEITTVESESMEYKVESKDGEVSDLLRGYDYQKVMKESEDHLKEQDSELERVLYLSKLIKRILIISILYGGVYHILTILGYINHEVIISRLGILLNGSSSYESSIRLMGAVMLYINYEDDLLNRRREVQRLKESKVKIKIN